MSLGWQGESALLPKRAKAISVDSTSMQSLRAEVMDEQEKRHQRQQDGRNAQERGGMGLRRLRGASGGKREQSRPDVFSRENRGVREREARDKKLQEHSAGDASMKRRADKVTLALQAKAKIYNQLQGAEMGSEGLEGGAAACQEVLVDFALKRKQHGNVLHHLEEQGNAGDAQDGYSDIEDEFGRGRRVLRSSDAYKSWQRKKNEHEVDNREEYQMERTEAIVDFADEQREQRERARDFLTEVRQEVHQQVAENTGRSGGVRSQWDEKVLRGQEREHLQALHQQTQQIRQRMADQVIALSGVDEAGISGKRHLDDSDSSRVTVSSSAADKRREILLQKQLQFKKQKLQQDK